MTKILILIFTVLLALNINASDTEPAENTTTTGDTRIISGQILVELTNHYGPDDKSSVIDTEVYFKIIERSQDELGLHINYDDYTLELFYDKDQNKANFTLLRQGRELHVIDDTLKKPLNTIISSLHSNLYRSLPKSYTRIESLRTIFKLLNTLTKRPDTKPIHKDSIRKDMSKSSHLDSFPDTRTNESLINLYDYTMICDSVGGQREAVYTGWDITNPIRRIVNVGDPASGCLGRSGAGCYPEVWLCWFWSCGWVQTGDGDTQYTQESLNHDVCADESDLGVFEPTCDDELAEASWGYTWAPNCF